MKTIIVKAENEFYRNQCKMIAKNNNEDLNIFNMPSHFVVAVEDEKVLGYASIKPNALGNKDLTVCDFQIDKKHLHKGVEKSILEKIKRHSKGFSVIIIHTLNMTSQKIKTFLENGFYKSIAYGVVKYKYLTNFIEDKQDFLVEENQLGE